MVNLQGMTVYIRGGYEELLIASFSTPFLAKKTLTTNLKTWLVGIKSQLSQSSHLIRVTVVWEFSMHVYEGFVSYSCLVSESHFSWHVQSYHEDVMEEQLVVEPIVCMLILHHKAWPRCV